MKDIYYRIKFVFTGDCGHACGFNHKYGYVPEADCPVHDSKPLIEL